MSLAVAGFFIIFCVATPGGFMSGLFFLFISSPFVALSFYFWLVVRSVYLDIKEESTRNYLPTTTQQAEDLLPPTYESVVTAAEKKGDYSKF